MEDWHNPMQRGITKSNRLEANSSPIAEPSVKAVSLKRNKTMKWLKTKIDNKKNRYAIEDDGYPVAIVVGETTANLIASTPEILEALKEIEKFANDEFPTSSSKLKHSSPSYDEVAGMKYDLLQRILIITHKAIAKAEGK